MKNFNYRLPLFFSLLILLASFSLQAQEKTKRIGNKPRMGSSNASFLVTKGHQVGIKMKAGRKPLQLLSLEFGANNYIQDSIPFKVNVYQFNKEQPSDSFTKEAIVATVPPGKNRINVDLSKYDIIVKGDILVSIEFLKSMGTSLSFSIGLFNGGTYRYEGSEWKKMPVAGADFNLTVKKL